jgi:lipopolysaccharide cholinephosphotransferase
VGAIVVLIATVPELREYAGLGVHLSGRPRIWEGVVRLGAERPLFGHGLLNMELRRLTIDQTPHSLYLAQFAYFGVIGLALFLVLLAAFGHLVLDNLREGPDLPSLTLAALLAAVLVKGLVEYQVTRPVFFTNSMFWICLGLLAGNRPAGGGRPMPAR